MSTTKAPLARGATAKKAPPTKVPVASVRVVAKRLAPHGASADAVAAPSSSSSSSATSATPVADSGRTARRGGESKRPRQQYDTRCKACLRRIKHFFLVNEIDTSQPTTFHIMLTFSTSCLDGVRDARSGKPNMKQLVKQYTDMRHDAAYVVTGLVGRHTFHAFIDDYARCACVLCLHHVLLGIACWPGLVLSAAPVTSTLNLWWWCCWCWCWWRRRRWRR